MGTRIRYEHPSLSELAEDLIALEASGHSRTGSERLYRAYCSWCDAQGHRRMSSKKWSMRMKRIGWQSMRSSGTKWLARLKGDSEQEAAERWSP